MTPPSRAGLEALLPGPGTAREWLREELSRREYQPSLGERFRQVVQDLLDRFRDATLGVGGFNPVVALLLLAVLTALAAFVLSRLRANPGGDVPTGAVFAEARLSASDHRAQAREALARDDWDTAVVETMRALAAGMFERGLVVEERGATAHEIVATAAGSFPARRDGLERAAATFDETLYGERPAAEAAAREIVALEEELRAWHPHRGTVSGPVAAVPR